MLELQSRKKIPETACSDRLHRVILVDTRYTRTRVANYGKARRKQANHQAKSHPQPAAAFRSPFASSHACLRMLTDTQATPAAPPNEGRAARGAQA